MAQSAHTPGPWSIAKDESGVEIGGGAEQYTTVFSESGFGSIAKVLYKKPQILGDSKTLAKKEFEANAVLIAAAPELLAALKGVISWVHGPEKWHTDAPIQAVEKARAAIEKATKTELAK